MTNPNFSHLSDSEIRETLMLQERLQLLQQQKDCQGNFLEFVNKSGGHDLEVEKGPTLPVEDDELKDKIENITAIMNLPDQGILGQVMSPAARSLQMAKRNFAKGARNMSKKFLDASK